MNLPSSWTEARKTGAQFYASPRPCVNGHTCPRRTSSRSCRLCEIDRGKKYYDGAGKYRARNYHLKNKYGITLEDFDRAFKAQGESCAICIRPLKSDNVGKGCGTNDTLAVVDHCHSTGKFRSILCNPCNIALGKFEDDIARLEAAIAYLKKHNNQ